MTSKRTNCDSANTDNKSKKQCSSSESSMESNYSEGNDFVVLDAPDKSESDKKTYKLIKLRNELRVLLISDPSELTDGEDVDPSDTTEEEEETEDHSDPEEEEENEDENEGESDEENEEKLAGVGLCVDVGSFSDPKSIQGLAHFLEHMIFMGSKKYPKENEYDSYIQKLGGFDNADTDCEETSFYFEITEKYLEGAIDRMAQLFTAPLMLREAMCRERLAVDSEFRTKINSDTYRTEQLLASMGNAEHPCSNFTWGNLKTLQEDIDDKELYMRVHEFHKRYYSAHRMHLCVQARLPIETLQNFVLKYFSGIPNNNNKPDDISSFNEKNAFSDDFHNKVCYVLPKTEMSKVELRWCLPPALHKYKCKPDDYLSNIMGFEGKGSLCAYLRKKLWALEVTAGPISEGFGNNRMYSIYYIEIILTNIKHLDDVIGAVFSYLKMIKREGPSEVIFREYQLLRENEFKFKNEESALTNVENLCCNMKYYPPKYIITAPELYFEYNEKEIKSIINLLNERTFNVMVHTSQPYKDIVFDKEEKWFGTKYTTRDFPSAWLDKWNNAPEVPELHLPECNKYICSSFEILHSHDKGNKVSEYPEIIFENDVCQAWFRPDNKFKLPFAFMRFYFCTPLLLENCRNFLLNRLYVKILKFELNEGLYPASIAGLSWSLFGSQKGIILHVNGFNEKLPLVIDTITNHIRDSINKDIDIKIFNAIKTDYIKILFNCITIGSAMCSDLRLSVIQNKHWTALHQYKEVQDITIDEVQEFRKKLFGQMKIHCLIQGNVRKDDALSITKNVLNNLQCSKLDDISSLNIRINQLPIGNKFICIHSFLEENVNSEVTNYYQYGPINFELEARLDLLDMLIEEPLFDMLRTKQQLGYEVSSTVSRSSGIIGYSITVKSQEDKNLAFVVEQKIEEFRRKFHTFLSDMKEEDFELIKNSLIKLKQSADTELVEEVDRNWGEIISEEYIFDRNKIQVEYLRKISKMDMVEFHRKLIEDPESNRKLSIQVIGDKKGKSDIKIIKTDDNIEDALKSISIPSEDFRILKDLKLKFANVIDTNLDNEYLKDLTAFKTNLYTYPHHKIRKEY